jgi:lambda family phage tail tape measure protein
MTQQNKTEIVITALNQTQQAFRELKGQFGGLANDLESAKGKFSALAGVMAGLGVTLSAGAFAAWIKSTIDAADEMGKMSQKVGVSVEALSELKYAGDLADVSLDQLGMGLKQLSKNMRDASLGGKEQIRSFNDLGVEIKNTDGTLRSTDDVFRDVAEKFSTMEDGAEKTALSMRMFGRSGADLIPLLNSGKSGLKDMATEARALGAVFTGEAAKGAEQFNDNLTTIKTSFAGFAIGIVNNGIMPLMDFIKSLQQASVAYFAFMDKLKAIDDAKWKGIITKTGRAELSRQMAIIDEAAFATMNDIEAKFAAKKAATVAGGGRTTDKPTKIARSLKEKAVKAETLPSAYAMETSELAAFSTKMAKWWESEDKARKEAADALVKELELKQQVREAEIQHQLSLVDTAEAYNQISEAEAAEQRLALNQELLSVQEQWLGTMDKATDASGWLAQAQAIEEARQKILGLSKAVQSYNGTAAQGWQEGIEKYKKTLPSTFQQMSDMAEGTANSMQGSFSEVFGDGMRGELKDLSDYFASFTNSLIDLWADAMAQMTMASMMGKSGGWGDFFGSLFSSFPAGTSQSTLDWLTNAKGNVFSSPSLSQYSGQVVSKPTFFKFAYGDALGVMGEGSDPEGIFPLARDKSGKLGVRAVGGGGSSLTIHMPLTVEGSKKYTSGLRREVEETVRKYVRDHS